VSPPPGAVMPTKRGSEGSGEAEGCLRPPSLSPIMRSTELLQKSGKKGVRWRNSMSCTNSSPTLQTVAEVVKEDAEYASRDSSALTKRRSTRATRSALPQKDTEQDEVTSHVQSAPSSNGSSRASAQHERMMELLENTQKVLSDNERLRLMLEKQKHPFTRLAPKEEKAQALVLQTSKAADEDTQTQTRTVIAATAEITRTSARRAQRSAAPPPPVPAEEKKIDKNPAMATKVLASKVLGPESLMGALQRGALIELGVTQVSPEQLQQQQLRKNMQAALEGENRHAAAPKQAEVLQQQAEVLLPGAMARVLEAPLASDWEERVSSSCGRVYYHNPKIGKSMWTRPSVGWPLLNNAESGASATPKMSSGASATPKMSHVESPRLIGTYPMPPKTDFLLDASTSAPPMALKVHALSDILTAKPAVMKHAQTSKAPQVLAARVMAPESVALAYEAGLLSNRVGARARVGLGIAVVRGNDNVLKITRVVPGYGADKSQQVRVGDSLEEIDGQSVTNHDLTAIRRLLVGREGTKCALRISRDNIPFTVYLIREQPADHASPQDSGRGVAPPAYPLAQPVSLHGEVTSSGAALASSAGGDRGRQSGVKMNRRVEGDATVYGVFAQMSSGPSSSAPPIGWSRAEWGPASSSSIPWPEPPAPVSIVAPVKQSLMCRACL
jgi:hypothetical protein